MSLGAIAFDDFHEVLVAVYEAEDNFLVGGCLYATRPAQLGSFQLHRHGHRP